MARRLAFASFAAAVALALGLGFACVADDAEEQFRGDVTPSPHAWIPAPLAEAHCEILVEGKGIKDLETDYLPRVITCENGGANLEALKAQAIAARSVAYYYIENQGSVCDSQGCQVYTCASPPSEKAYQAVEETSGLYLNYNGVLTYAFYVAGDSNTSPPQCVGTPGVGTENWVTYNQNKSGTDVEQTNLGWVFNPGEPGYGQNRGCHSQWGARCLENNNGYDYEQILRFYYGEDINITQAQGSCVLELGDGDGDPGDGDGDPSTGDGDGDPSTGDGDGDPSTGDGDGECTIGSLGCMCTMGGGCDPGLICANGNCVPEAPGEEEGAGDGDNDDDQGGGETSPGFRDDAFGEGEGCECSTQSRSNGVVGLLLLGLLGFVRRSRSKMRSQA
ncbi:MAG: SpoIID/LytB domain-containing protein [Enhygromyxa sp.]